MLAKVMLHDGTDITSHQTFIEPDGSGKAEIEKPRLSPQAARRSAAGYGSARRILSTNSLSPKALKLLLSALRIFGVTAGCAALSAGGVCNLILPPEERLLRIFADHDELGQVCSAAHEAARRWRGEGRIVRATMSETVGEDANDVLLARLRKQK